MKNIFIVISLILAGFFGYNYFTSNSTKVVLDSASETSTQKLANNWDDITLPKEIENHSNIEACDTTEANICFGSGSIFYKETKDVTVASLVSTAETSRYGVQVKKTGELFVFSIENDISDDELDFGNIACYKYEGSEEGVTETRELKLDIYGTKVTGTKLGYSQSVEYSVGYEGIVEGVLNSLGGNTVNAITTLTIADGGEIRQEEIYILGENSMTEMRYRLVDDFKNSILRIDKSIKKSAEGQIFPIEYKYNKVECPL